MVHDQGLHRIRPDLPLGADPAAVRRRVEALERLLEGLVELPLVGRKLGLDAILGLLPGVGDVIGGLLGLYLVWEARRLGMPRWQVWRMAGHVGLDALLGVVPLAGDLVDVLYRSNSRNLRIIRQHLDRHHPGSVTIQG